MPPPTPYDAFAGVYAIWTGSAPVTEANREFYLEELAGAAGPVVELGVGDGRIAVEAARRGKAVIGVDDSAGMLELCRRRAAEAGVGDRIRLLQADMRTFRLEEPAELVVIPFHTIGHLLSPADKRDCLAHVHAELAPGGRLVFDHFVFDPELARKNDGVPVLRAEYVDAESGRDARLWALTRCDFAECVLHVQAIVEELGTDGAVCRRTVHPLQLSWIDPPEVRALLEDVGYTVEAVYGAFDRRPLAADSPTQVWVARRV